MRDGEATHRVHFLNISKTGALMHADRPPAVGATCTFGVVGNLGIAKVVWVDGKRFGIHFLVPLTDAALEAALRAG